MQPLGMENGIILDSQITAPGSDSKYSRLNGNKTWCAKSDNAILTIDLGRIITVTGLAFQGKACPNQQLYFTYAVKDINDLKLTRPIKTGGQYLVILKVVCNNDHGMCALSITSNFKMCNHTTNSTVKSHFIVIWYR